ncbi:MAG: hydratase [Beijerinckiaceae bacterium]|nr:hydratase [Beijerinckiaceae bacterium]
MNHAATAFAAFETATIAREVLDAQRERRQIAPFSDAASDFDLAAAYRVNGAVRAMREQRGEQVAGRKIGFTNTSIWDEYDVHAPIWSYVYRSTLHFDPRPDRPFDLAALVEPRIEPEVALHLKRAPTADMDAFELLRCIDRIFHGFEIVQSLYPGWRFKAPDTVAAFGLHGALFLGPPLMIEDGNAAEIAERLSSFRITLLRDGVPADNGHAGLVLGGGPLVALKHLIDVLAADPESPALSAGEIITTGTLTRALPVHPGERWSVAFDGLPLASVELALG